MSKSSSRPKLPLSIALGFGVLLSLLAPGCGSPPPEANSNPPPKAAVPEAQFEALKKKVLGAGASVGWDGSQSYHYSVSGDWEVVFFSAPSRRFWLKVPAQVSPAPVAPKKVHFFSEGKDLVVLQPRGAPRMAFHFRVPEGMRPRRSGKGPIHLQGADVWIFRDGDSLELEWVDRRVPGWLGTTPCHDFSGQAIPVDGALHLPEGWVGVPGKKGIFQVGQDRAYGPYRPIQEGLWTSLEDPHPLAVDLLPELHARIEATLGPAPQIPEHLILESCGDCPRPEPLGPVLPRSERDDRVAWIRLGSPGANLFGPGPLRLQTLQRWLPAEDGDPTALALVHLYARALFPRSALDPLAFLPPPSFQVPLLDRIRSWTRHQDGPEAKALIETVLPGIFFEARTIDPKAFDQVVRGFAKKGSIGSFETFVGALKEGCAPCLEPLRLRGLATP